MIRAKKYTHTHRYHKSQGHKNFIKHIENVYIMIKKGGRRVSCFGVGERGKSII